MCPKRTFLYAIRINEEGKWVHSFSACFMSENTECYKYFLRSAFEVESLVEAKPHDNFFLLELKVMRTASPKGAPPSHHNAG